MRVFLQDRDGPRRNLGALALGGLFATAVGVLAWLVDPRLAGSGDAQAHVDVASYCMGVAAFLFALAISDPFRFSSRVVDVDVRPGELRVRRGIGGFAIQPGDIDGATTAHHEGKVALTMVLRSRPRRPVTFLFESDSDAEGARAALGLSRDGTGETHFPTEAPDLVFFGRILATGAAAVALLLVAGELAPDLGNRGFSSTDVMGAGNLMLLATVAFSCMRFLLPTVRKTRRIALRPEALYVPTDRGSSTIPYAAIRHVIHAGNALVIEVLEHPQWRVPTCLSEDECAVLASHVEARRRRALGGVTRRAEITERLAALGRRGEPVQVWMARLDAVAAAMSAHGYRGAAIDREDLRLAVEDFDLHLDVRLAAGRLLAKVDPQSRVRVADAGAASSSPQQAKLFSIADGTADELAQVYEEYEAVKGARRRRVP